MAVASVTFVTKQANGEIYFCYTKSENDNSSNICRKHKVRRLHEQY